MENYQEKEFKENIAIAGKTGRNMDALALITSISAVAANVLLPLYLSGVIKDPKEAIAISLAGMLVCAVSSVTYGINAYRHFTASDRWMSALEYQCENTP